jgi:hypothetical protein
VPARYLHGAASSRLHLNAFQGEPAISGFAWHFTSTHRSSQCFAMHPGSALHARVPRASACPWVAHPVSGRILATHRPFGLAFAPAPRVTRLASPPRCTRRLILQKARRHPDASRDPCPPSRVSGHVDRAPTGQGHGISGSISLPSPGCFSPFPHGTGSLSVAGGI